MRLHKQRWLQQKLLSQRPPERGQRENESEGELKKTSSEKYSLHYPDTEASASGLTNLREESMGAM